MKKRILILDDKETIGKVLMMYLATEYDCTWFDNPLKGLDWMRQGNIPDLIISDIRMPEMRGDEFLAYLKKDLMFASVPVVILSGEDSSTGCCRKAPRISSSSRSTPWNLRSASKKYSIDAP